MANIFKKIKHMVHPQTKDILNQEAKKIGEYFKKLQEDSEALAKQARKIKQKIKSNMKITEEQAKAYAKTLANETFKKPQSYIDISKNILTDLKKIATKLGLNDTAHKLNSAICFITKSKAESKNEQANLADFINLDIFKQIDSSPQDKDSLPPAYAPLPTMLNHPSYKYISKFYEEKINPNSPIFVNLDDINGFINHYNRFFQGYNQFERIPFIKYLDEETPKFFDTICNKQIDFLENTNLSQTNKEMYNQLTSIFFKFSNNYIIITKSDPQKRKHVYFSSKYKDNESQFRNFIAENKYCGYETNMKDTTEHPISWFYMNHEADVKDYLQDSKQLFNNSITITEK